MKNLINCEINKNELSVSSQQANNALAENLIHLTREYSAQCFTVTLKHRNGNPPSIPCKNYNIRTLYFFIIGEGLRGVSCSIGVGWELSEEMGEVNVSARSKKTYSTKKYSTVQYKSFVSI